MPLTRILVQQPQTELIEGVAHYAQQHSDWRFVAFSAHLVLHEQVDFSDATAIISDTKNSNCANILRKSGLPWVNIRYPLAETTSVLVDRVAVGRLVAEHFNSLGLAGAAYAAGTRNDDLRGFKQAFRGAVRELPAMTSLRALRRALETAPKPCGVFCSSDGRAVHLIDTCLDWGLRIPEDIAVCGVNNNAFQAICAKVPLTSVDVNMFAMAETAARLIDQRLRQHKALPKQVLVPPKALITRRSTDCLLRQDDDLHSILQFLENGIDEGVQVEDVFTHFVISRSTLERRFKQRFQQTPGAWLQERRLALACQYLRNEDWDLASIAAHCGFSSASYLARAFKKHYGITPGAWRLT